MRTMLILAASLAAITTHATPSTNTFAAVTNDWYNASFTNVYELAQSRLAANTNDVVGAYLMLEWDITFSSLATISNSVTRVLRTSDLVAHPAFTNEYSQIRQDFVSFRDEYLPLQREENREQEQMKSRLPHSNMTSDYILKILWDNGLWQQTEQ